ncbi:MAG: hypothetical protein IJB72_07085, partial [Clostridia bacterium]|nr:hypothetical protein [Clostridia bacterium]
HMQSADALGAYIVAELFGHDDGLSYLGSGRRGRRPLQQFYHFVIKIFENSPLKRSVFLYFC